MNKLMAALALLLFVGTAAHADAPPDPAKQAVAFVNLLVGQKYPDAAAQFDDRMKAALPADQLQTAWQQVTGQMGEFKNTGATKVTEAQEHTIVFVEGVFTKGSFWVQVAYDKDGKVGGLHFFPETPKR